MHILEAAPLRRPINDAMQYGAVERVVRSFAAEFDELGHNAEVLALPGTELPVHVVEVGRETDDLDQRYVEQGQAIVEAAGSADIVHTHIYKSLGGISLALGKKAGNGSVRTAMPPIFTTIHGPAERTAHLHEEFIGTLGIHVLALSEQHRRQLERHIPVEAVVPLGVNADYYNPATVKPGGGYALTLGRVVAEKGVSDAIDAAEAAGIPIVIAGPRVTDRPEDAAYFDNVIQPRINGDSVQYVGPVDDRQKLRLLQGATALIHLSKVDETFGLSPLEAGACGVPVLASARGALPDIVQDGVTGYICDSVEAAVEGLSLLDRLDAKRVRQYVVDNFSWRIAAQEFMRVVEKIAG